MTRAVAIALLLFTSPVWAIKFTYTTITQFSDGSPVGPDVRGTFYGECGNGTVELITNFVNDGAFNHDPLETGVECTYWIMFTSLTTDDSAISNIVTRTDP